jgi:site-specific recombinase XerD
MGRPIVHAGRGVKVVVHLPTPDVNVEDRPLAIDGKGDEEFEVPFAVECRETLLRKGKFEDRH